MLSLEAIQLIRNKTYIMTLNKDVDVSDFEGKFEDYTLFLKDFALQYQEKNIAKTYLLIDKNTDKITAYMTISTDSIPIYPNEKKKHNLSDVKFNFIPALKVGKLAVSINYQGNGYGSFLLEIAKMFVNKINKNGVACRFLTVDADIENDERLVEFYGKNGFVSNKKVNKDREKALSEGDLLKTVSMRLDVFSENKTEDMVAID